MKTFKELFRETREEPKDKFVIDKGYQAGRDKKFIRKHPVEKGGVEGKDKDPLFTASNVKHSKTKANPEVPAYEETQVNELSAKTTASYLVKAHVSGTKAAGQGEEAYQRMQKTSGRDKYRAQRVLNKANLTGEKRETGIKLAARKIAKEEVLDEAKKKAQDVHPDTVVSTHSLKSGGFYAVTEAGHKYKLDAGKLDRKLPKPGTILNTKHHIDITESFGSAVTSGLQHAAARTAYSLARDQVSKTTGRVGLAATGMQQQQQLRRRRKNKVIKPVDAQEPQKPAGEAGSQDGATNSTDNTQAKAKTRPAGGTAKKAPKTKAAKEAEKGSKAGKADTTKTAGKSTVNDNPQNAGNQKSDEYLKNKRKQKRKTTGPKKVSEESVFEWFGAPKNPARTQPDSWKMPRFSDTTKREKKAKTAGVGDRTVPKQNITTLRGISVGKNRVGRRHVPEKVGTVSGKKQIGEAVLGSFYQLDESYRELNYSNFMKHLNDMIGYIGEMLSEAKAFAAEVKAHEKDKIFPTVIHSDRTWGVKGLARTIEDTKESLCSYIDPIKEDIKMNQDFGSPKPVKEEAEVDESIGASSKWKTANNRAKVANAAKLSKKGFRQPGQPSKAEQRAEAEKLLAQRRAMREAAEINELSAETKGRYVEKAKADVDKLHQSDDSLKPKGLRKIIKRKQGIAAARQNEETVVEGQKEMDHADAISTARNAKDDENKARPYAVTKRSKIGHWKTEREKNEVVGKAYTKKSSAPPLRTWGEFSKTHVPAKHMVAKAAGTTLIKKGTEPRKHD